MNPFSKLRKRRREAIFGGWLAISISLWNEHNRLPSLHYWLHQTKWKFKDLTCIQRIFMRLW